PTRGATLDETVALHPEDPTLRVHHGLIVDGAILEAEQQPALDAILAGDLDEITERQRLALERPHRREGPGDAFRKADGDRLAPGRSREPEHQSEPEEGRRPEAHPATG